MASQDQALRSEWMNYFHPSVHVEPEAPSSVMGTAFDEDYQLFGGAPTLDLTPEYLEVAQAIEHIPSFDDLAQTSSFDLENAGAFDESVNLNQSTGQVNTNVTNGSVGPIDDLFEGLPVDTFVNQNQLTGQVNANMTNGNVHQFDDLFEEIGNDLPVDTYVDPIPVCDISAHASSTISGQNLVGFTTTVPQAAHSFTTPMAVSTDVDTIVASSIIDPALLYVGDDTNVTNVDHFGSIDWSNPNLKFSKELNSQISNQVNHELADQFNVPFNASFNAPFNEEFVEKLSGYGMPLPKTLNRPNSACRSSRIVNSSELRAPAPPMKATQPPVAPPTVAPPPAAPTPAAPTPATPAATAAPPCAYVALTPASPAAPIAAPPVPAAAAHVPGSLAQAHPSSDDGAKWESVWENIGPEDIAHMAACGVGASTKFKSADEARNSQRRFAPLPEDLTIPRDEDTKRTMVACLVRAMASTGSAFDSEKTVQPFLSGRYTTEALEVAAWELMDAMIRRHTDGGSLTTTHLSKPAGRFLDRFLLVRKALTEYKSICKHVLDPLYVHTFVDEPTAAFKRVEANKKVNDRKSGQISAGKKALAGESAQVVTPASTPQRQSSASQLVTPPNTNKRKSSGEEACSKRPRQF